jgi:hypothetical protein
MRKVLFSWSGLIVQQIKSELNDDKESYFNNIIYLSWDRYHAVSLEGTEVLEWPLQIGASRRPFVQNEEV